MRSIQITSLLSDAKFQSLTGLLVTADKLTARLLSASLGDESWDVECWLGVAGVPHFGEARTVVDDHYLAIKVHGYFSMIILVSRQVIYINSQFEDERSRQKYH